MWKDVVNVNCQISNKSVSKIGEVVDLQGRGRGEHCGATWWMLSGGANPPLRPLPHHRMSQTQHLTQNSKICFQKYSAHSISHLVTKLKCCFKISDFVKCFSLLMLYLYPIIGFWGFFNFGEVAECVLLKTEGEETTSKLNPHQFAAIFTVATKKYLRAFFS